MSQIPTSVTKEQVVDYIRLHVSVAKRIKGQVKSTNTLGDAIDFLKEITAGREPLSVKTRDELEHIAIIEEDHIDWINETHHLPDVADPQLAGSMMKVLNFPAATQ